MYRFSAGKPRLVQFEANPRTVNSALESIRVHVHLLGTISAPCWLQTQPGNPQPDKFLTGWSQLRLLIGNFSR